MKQSTQEAGNKRRWVRMLPLVLLIGIRRDGSLLLPFFQSHRAVFLHLVKFNMGGIQCPEYSQPTLPRLRDTAIEWSLRENRGLALKEWYEASSHPSTSLAMGDGEEAAPCFPSVLGGKKKEEFTSLVKPAMTAGKLFPTSCVYISPIQSNLSMGRYSW